MIDIDDETNERYHRMMFVEWLKKTHSRIFHDLWSAYKRGLP